MPRCEAGQDTSRRLPESAKRAVHHHTGERVRAFCRAAAQTTQSRHHHVLWHPNVRWAWGVRPPANPKPTIAAGVAAQGKSARLVDEGGGETEGEQKAPSRRAANQEFAAGRKGHIKDVRPSVLLKPHSRLLTTTACNP